MPDPALPADCSGPASHSAALPPTAVQYLTTSSDTTTVRSQWVSARFSRVRCGQGNEGLTGAPCVIFTDVVKSGEASNMKDKPGSDKKMKVQSTAQVRATISFPPNVYETLEVIAKEKKVSLAWVVRDATEKYIEDRWPLLKGQA